MFTDDGLAGIGAETVGDKAAELGDLYRVARHDGCFVVPRFCVLPAAVLDDYYTRESWDPALEYAELPHASDIPPGIRAGLSEFNAFAKREVAQCIDHFDAPIILRSSLVRPPGSVRAGYGCNSTHWAGRTKIAEIHDSPVMPGLFASFYKAHTSWVLDPSLRWHRRVGGVVFMEAIEYRCLGAAFLHEDGLIVEVDGRNPVGRQRYRCDPKGVVSHAVEHEVLTERDLRLLATAASEVREGLGHTGVTEIEFGIGHDDRLWLVQTRQYASRPGEPPARTGIFHSVGTMTGPLRDLRKAGRTRATVDQVSAVLAENAILLLQRESDRFFDLFALVWSVSAALAESGRAPALLVEDTGELLHGAGFRNHLMRALMENFPTVFTGQVAGGFPGVETERVQLRSDGSLLSISPEQRHLSGRRIP